MGGRKLLAKRKTRNRTTMTKELTIEFTEWVNSTYNKSAKGWVPKMQGAPNKNFYFTTGELYDIFQERMTPAERLGDNPIEGFNQ